MTMRGVYRRALPFLMVISLLLGSHSTVLASPDQPKPNSSPLPRLSPAPQTIESTGADVVLPKRMRLIAGADTDPTALELLRQTLQDYGIELSEKHAGNAEIYVGGPEETSETAAILADLGRQGPERLPDEGYVIAVERNRGVKVVLAGKDPTGTYYAVVTLLQLLQKQGNRVSLPSLHIADYPAIPFRGGEESFYGPLWSWDDRYDQIDFLSSQKMNYYFYGPADDARTTGRLWRELYSAAELEQFRQLVEYAHAKHVKFLYRMGPESPQHGGNAPGICHARPSDRDALISRLEQMYSIGVRKFVISWDDVTESFTCEEDRQRYGSGLTALAAAQAEVLNDVQERFFDVYPDLERGVTIPSQYWLNEPTPYRDAFDELTTDLIDIYWTGPHVVSYEIEEPDLKMAQKAFPRHRLLLFDNYPVNDYNRNRLLLGPLDRRAATMPNFVTGISWNEMNEQKASQIALFTASEYAWNPKAYHPEQSWEAGLRKLGGSAYDALSVFADANRYDGFMGRRQAPVLNRLIEDLKFAYLSGENISAQATALYAYETRMSEAPERLRTDLPGLAQEVEPWLDKLALAANAVKAGTDLLAAMAEQDGVAAASANETLSQAKAALRSNPKETAVGVIEPFLDFAADEYAKLQRRHLSLAVPYGLRSVAKGEEMIAEVFLYATSPGRVTGTLTVTAPQGWVVSEPNRPIDLASQGRSVTGTFRTTVEVPENAAPGTIAFRFEDTEGRIATAQTSVFPATRSERDYSDLVLDAGPSGYWRLDDVTSILKDSSGNGLNGDYRSGVTQGVPGVTRDGNAAAYFHGGYAEIPSSAAVSPDGPFTIEAWIQPEIIAGGEGQGIAEKYSVPARSGFLIRLDGANRLLAFTMSGTSASSVAGGPGIGPGTWHHVAAVYDGTSHVIYLDGVEVGRNTNPIAPEPGPISLKIGARGDDRDRRFTGLIDEVALYDRALTAGEIAQRFLAGVQ